MRDMNVRKIGNANAQVNEEVKSKLYEWLSQFPVESAEDAIHFHHYSEGKFVAMSVHGSLDDITQFNKARRALLSDGRNREINEDTVWIHREWIQEELF